MVTGNRGRGDERSQRDGRIERQSKTEQETLKKRIVIDEERNLIAS